MIASQALMGLRSIVVQRLGIERCEYQGDIPEFQYHRGFSQG
jgi:hypothetical protein